MPKVPPKVNGTYVAAYCNFNQMWFMNCIKAFTIIFTYTNTLAIPWRMAIALNLFFDNCGSHRDVDRSGKDVAGVDFYGRKTEAMWFHIPQKNRKWIAVFLNLAWIFHYFSLVTHMIYWTYLDNQIFPGKVWTNAPFLLSIASGVYAGVMQGKAETRLRKEQPGRFPEPPMKFYVQAFKKWRKKDFPPDTPKRERSLKYCVKHAFDDDLPGPKGSPAKKTNRKKTGRTGMLTSINADVVAVDVAVAAA